MPPRDLAALADMLLAAGTIRQYIAGVTEALFMEDALRRDAVIRQIEIIGEAARRVSEATRGQIPQLPWMKIVGMRNMLIHAYDHVDSREVWRVTQEDIPALTSVLDTFVPSEEEFDA